MKKKGLRVHPLCNGLKKNKHKFKKKLSRPYPDQMLVTAECGPDKDCCP